MEPEVQDVSMSFRDLSVDPADTSFIPPSSGSPSSTGTTSESASSIGDTATGWAERKWLVNKSHLLQLFKTCPECNSLIKETTITIKGSQIKIQWNCGKHFGDWQSCPDRRGMPENNLQICAATFFTGSTFTDIADWASLLNIQIPQKTHFYNIQTTYVLPTIQCTYQDKRDKIISRLHEESQSGKQHKLCGDARCDSPGKYLILTNIRHSSHTPSIKLIPPATYWVNELICVFFFLRLQYKVLHVLLPRWCHEGNCPFWVGPGNTFFKNKKVSNVIKGIFHQH